MIFISCRLQAYIGLCRVGDGQANKSHTINTNKTLLKADEAQSWIEAEKRLGYQRAVSLNPNHILRTGSI